MLIHIYDLNSYEMHMKYISIVFMLRFCTEGHDVRLDFNWISRSEAGDRQSSKHRGTLASGTSSMPLEPAPEMSSLSISTFKSFQNIF